MEEIQRLGIYQGKLNAYLKRHYPELFKELVSRTHFLDNFYKDRPVPIPARLYCLEHNLKEQPKCQHPECNNPVKWKIEGVFGKYCSRQCMFSDENHWENIRSTNLIKYGGISPMKSRAVSEKVKSTLLNRYGVENPSNIEDVVKKRRETNLKRRGVETPFQSQEVIDKIKLSCLERYGKSNISGTDIWREKVKSTCIQKYGVEHALQSKEVRDKGKQTCLDKYGVEYVSQSPQFRNRVKATFLRKYGVENYSQTPEFHKKAHKRYTNPKYPNMTFGSSWEFLVYDFLLENHIDFEYQPEISLPYDYEGTHHTYHPDFIINNNVIEVKGDNFFRINESTGKEEMFCPYRDEDWSDEKYDWMCGLYEAKHQCMLKNNVRILRDADIRNLTVQMFEPITFWNVP